MCSLKDFRFFPYYLNSRRLADLTGESIPLESQTSLINNSSKRVVAMDSALRLAKRIIYSGEVPNLATVAAKKQLGDDRILAFVWGKFAFRGASKALALESAGKPVQHATFSGKIPLGDEEYGLHGTMFNEHYYSDSSLTVLTKKRRMFILGHFQFHEDLSADVSPYVIGELTEEGFFSISFSSSVRVYPQFIDQFKKVEETSIPTAAEVRLGFRLNHSQNATRVAKATAERKFLASLS